MLIDGTERSDTTNQTNHTERACVGRSRRLRPLISSSKSDLSVTRGKKVGWMDVCRLYYWRLPHQQYNRAHVAAVAVVVHVVAAAAKDEDVCFYTHCVLCSLLHKSAHSSVDAFSTRRTLAHTIIVSIFHSPRAGPRRMNIHPFGEREREKVGFICIPLLIRRQRRRQTEKGGREGGPPFSIIEAATG